MAANTPFKKLTCKACKQWKIDRTGKAKGTCCGAPMVLSENWYVRVTLRGQTTTKSVSPRKRDAEDYIANCKTAARQGNLLPGQEKDITWAEAVQNVKQWWEDAVSLKEIKQSTADYYGFQLIPLGAHFEKMSLLTIKKGDVKDYKAARAKAGIAPTTINHEVKALKRIYAMHVERTCSDESPKLCAKASDIAQVDLAGKNGKKVRFLDEKEIRLLLEHSEGMVRIASLIALNMGLRIANVKDLMWEEVRLSKRVVNIPGEKMKSGNDYTGDIPDHLVAILKEWRKVTRLSPRVFPDWQPDGEINKGKKREEKSNTFRTLWKATVEKCGFRDVTFHTLRHTFASQFLMHGGDLSTLSEIMDHSSIQITKDLYGHLSRDHKKKAVQQFADAFLANF